MSACVSADERACLIAAPLSAAALTGGTLVRWPPAHGVMSYHFPMVADRARNDAFDRALVRAIASFKLAHDDRSPRVLDIGSGSGLLAMMAARAGALEVHSLEMVPQVHSHSPPLPATHCRSCHMHVRQQPLPLLSDIVTRASCHPSLCCPPRARATRRASS